MNIQIIQEDFKYMLRTGRGVNVTSKRIAEKEYKPLFDQGFIYYDGFSCSIKLTDKGKSYIPNLVEELKFG